MRQDRLHSFSGFYFALFFSFACYFYLSNSTGLCLAAIKSSAEQTQRKRC